MTNYIVYDKIIIGDTMNNRKGFTLIELLVAITIIGIIPSIHPLEAGSPKLRFFH